MTTTGRRGIKGLTPDTGVLLVLERGDSRVRVLLRRALETDLSLSISAGIVAQAWRDDPRRTRVARLLADPSVHVAPLDDMIARAVGPLCGRSDHRDIVDIHVAPLMQEQGHTAVTSDPEDLSAVHPSSPLITA